MAGNVRTDGPVRPREIPGAGKGLNMFWADEPGAGVAETAEMLSHARVQSYHDVNCLPFPPGDLKRPYFVLIPLGVANTATPNLCPPTVWPT